MSLLEQFVIKQQYTFSLTLNLSDEAEEEEMLKRAIAMSLEQQEEEPSSIKGKLLKNITTTAPLCHKQRTRWARYVNILQIFRWGVGEWWHGYFSCNYWRGVAEESWSLFPEYKSILTWRLKASPETGWRTRWGYGIWRSFNNILNDMKLLK